VWPCSHRHVPFFRCGVVDSPAHLDHCSARFTIPPNRTANDYARSL
jgi:hypothetical protein